MSGSQVKGFRQPSKKDTKVHADATKQQMMQMQQLLQLAMQQVYRFSTEVQVQGRELEAMANLIGTVQVPDGEGLKEGDTALINYCGVTQEDGLPFEGGSARRTAVRIGSKSFIPGFEEALIGKKVGESMDQELTFPKEYHAKELAGKTVVFKVLIIDAYRDRIDATEFNAAADELFKKKQDLLAEAAKAEAPKVSEEDTKEETTAQN